MAAVYNVVSACLVEHMILWLPESFLSEKFPQAIILELTYDGIKVHVDRVFKNKRLVCLLRDIPQDDVIKGIRLVENFSNVEECDSSIRADIISYNCHDFIRQLLSDRYSRLLEDRFTALARALVECCR